MIIIIIICNCCTPLDGVVVFFYVRHRSKVSICLVLLCDKKCQHDFHIESIVDEIPVVSVMKEYRIIFLLGTKFVGSIIIVVNVFLAPELVDVF